MSALTTLIDGTYTVVDADGAAYQIRAHFTLEMETAFQLAVLADEVALVEATKSLYSAEKYAERSASVDKQFRRGDFSPMSPKGAGFLQTQKGIVRVMMLLCPTHTLGEVTALLSIEGVDKIVQTILNESFGLEKSKKNLVARGMWKEPTTTTPPS